MAKFILKGEELVLKVLKLYQEEKLVKQESGEARDSCLKSNFTVHFPLII